MVFYIVLITALLLSLAYLFLYLFKIQLQLRQEPAKAKYRYVKNEKPTFTHSTSSKKVNETCSKSLHKSLKKLERKYSRIILTHGTFVGDDVFGITPLLEKNTSQINAAFLTKVKSIAALGTDKIAGDQGKFTDKYKATLKEHMSQNFQLDTFTWGSENNHAGRFRGFISLVKFLVANPQKNSRGKTLLIGHSHAAQVFALLTRLKEESTESEFGEFVLNNQFDLTLSTHEINEIRSMDFDFVTLGSPVRYKWGPGSYKVLHIINHKGGKLSGIGLKGLFKSKYGDYVQVLGTHGSDFVPTAAKDRELNNILSGFLESSSISPSTWYKTIYTASRLHPKGLNLLASFGEKDTNPVQSFFGHTVYLRIEYICFVFDLISKFIDKSDATS